MASIHAICAIGSAGIANAQSFPVGQGVADRTHPDYDPLGHRLGGFTLYPAVQTSVDATDNYRATDIDPQSDAFLTVRPNVRLLSNWARHRIDLNGYIARSFHFGRSIENVTQFGTTVAGVYDVSRRTAVRVDLAATRGAESRASLGSFRNAARPVQFSNLRGGVAVTQDFDPVSLDLLASLERVNFQDAELIGAGRVDQDFRDVEIAIAGGSVRYDMRNGVGLLLTGRYQRNSYDFGPGNPRFNPLVNIDRQSSGMNLLGGVSLELTKLIIGHVQLGYLTRNYRDGRLRDVSGLSFDADLLWNVTPLTSIRLRGARSVDETSSEFSSGNIRSNVTLSVDHELYRNVILNAETYYGSFTPNGIGFGGNEFGLRAGARYLISRRFTLTGNVRYDRRESESEFLRYRAISGGVGLGFAF